MKRRTIVLAVLALLLAGTVAAGSALVATERTALDSGYVIDRIAAEDLYDEARAPFVAAMRDRLAESGDPVAQDTPPGIVVRSFDRDAIAEAAVAEAFGPARIDSTIEGIYGYLHGRRGSEALRISLADVQTAYAARVTEEAIRIDVAAVAAVGGETPGPIVVDATTIERLRANESSYRATRAAFRESLPPDVDREALARRAKAALEPAIAAATAEYDPAVTEAVTGIQFATVDALAGDLSYEGYTSRLESAEDSLRTVAGERVRERVDDLAPAAITLDTADAPFPNIDDPAATVRLLDLLVWVLPVVALAMAVLVHWLTRSTWSTGRTAGGAVLGAGVLSLGTALFARGPIVAGARDAIAADGGGIGAVVAPLVEGFLDRLVVQSLLLVAVGAALLGIVWTDRRGHLDGVRSALGREPAPVETSEDSTDDTDDAGGGDTDEHSSGTDGAT